MTIVPMIPYDHNPQDDHASKVKEMVESHTSEIAVLSEKFRGEVESKLTEQKKDIKVKIAQVHIL